MVQIEKWYFVKYRLYNINNVAHFSTFSQYLNWSDVLKKNFGDFFEIVQMIEYDK